VTERHVHETLNQAIESTRGHGVKLAGALSQILAMTKGHQQAIDRGRQRHSRSGANGGLRTGGVETKVKATAYCWWQAEQTPRLLTASSRLSSVPPPRVPSGQLADPEYVPMVAEVP
jgi:hypothetical protein